jgi:hypothetical protein
MPERSSKPKSKKKDVNETAFAIMQQATGQDSKQDTTPSEKNPAAVALGRLGGLKGGVERAKRLSPARLKSIAKKGAAARWGKKQPKKKT